MAINKRKYSKWLSELKQNIYQSKIQTALQINRNMLMLYWILGKQITDKVEIEGWGMKIVDQLSHDLQFAFPDLKGFARRNLMYMKTFYKAYPNLLIVQQAAAQLEKKRQSTATTQLAANDKNYKKKIVQQAAAQIGDNYFSIPNPLLVNIPWGHHMLLLDKISCNEERIWYIQKIVEHNWSRSVLLYQIESGLYERQQNKKKSSNFHLTLPKRQGELANAILKDPYKFDFLQINERTTERDLELKLITHIQEFLIELGAGFAFVGRQYKLKLGRKEYFIDLLFYHLKLRCYIIIELKLDEFEFAHSGQMNGYLNIVDHQLKTDADNPTIGIILCSSKDDIEVDFALKHLNRPIGVSEYCTLKTLPKNIREALPTPLQLKNEIKRFLQYRNQSRVSKKTKEKATTP
ncbi:PDDEXK nuclease domain-containing protein [Danxiaibacter flavus]|uniref:PDDEXK nuclease domain-containing protein n=1 Tax=Danxiaibacter flavus TaxID=3049108 RepID=A0ABV3Z989_9BACT|nr:PDDEXK nuclease domain-containing protein [Chitinophagaceae bacterium DXS]